MISSFERIEELFRGLDAAMPRQAKIYIIGGAALMYHRVPKPYTKDVDVIATGVEQCAAMAGALKALGFSEIKRRPGTHNQLDIFEMLEKGDFRIDIFCKVVCSRFRLTKTMAARAKNILSLGKLDVFVCSKEDIFIFKSLTDRPQDMEDSIGLVKTGMDWNVVYNEIVEQYRVFRNKGKAKYILLYVHGRMEKLENMGITLPVKARFEKFLDSLIFENPGASGT